MGKVVRHLKDGQKEFQKVISELCYTKSSWQVWSDFVALAAINLSNVFDTSKLREEREQQYLSIIGTYSKEEAEKFPKLLAIMVNELEANPEQDFLGDLFMALELSNHWKGQIFTPYCVCQMMAKMDLNGIEAKIEKQGYVSILDPACGAGALLVAARNTTGEKKIDWSTKALFIAQDIDTTAALMCYIQLSLLGCAGYVVIGDSLVNPITGPHVLLPVANENQDIWFTPTFYLDVWRLRRTAAQMDLFLRSVKPSPKAEPLTPEETEQAHTFPVITLNADKTGQLTLF